MLEDDLSALLLQHCPRVYPVVAQPGAAMPYVTFQAVGGPSLRWMENRPSDKRFARVQINVWHTDLRAASVLLRQVEDAVCATDVFQAEPEGEAIDATDELGAAMGRHQTFLILGAR